MAGGFIPLPPSISYGPRSPLEIASPARRQLAIVGGLVLAVCNGFQIACEAGLLPGVLMRNARLKFICKEVFLRIERSDTPFTRQYNAGDVIRVPVAHGEGNYIADADTIARLEGIGVARRAAHPNAAILFYDFMLTQAQELLNARDYFPMSRKVKPLVELPSLTFLDPARILDNNQKWSKYYRDTFISRAR